VAFEDAVGIADVGVEEIDDGVLVAGGDQVGLFVIVEGVHAAVDYVQMSAVKGIFF